MQIQSEQNGPRVVVKLAGELDHHAAQAVRMSLDAMLTPGVRDMTLDLADLRFMDSSGIGVIIGRYKKLAVRGGTMSVKNANEQVDKVLRMSGLYSILQKQ